MDTRHANRPKRGCDATRRARYRLLQRRRDLGAAAIGAQLGRQAVDPLAAPSVVTSLDGLLADVAALRAGNGLKARLSTGAGAIITTHDPADAIELGARVLLMRDGRVIADGSHESVASGERGEWARSFLLAGDD